MVGEVEYGRREGSVINGPRASIQRPRSFFAAVMMIIERYDDEAKSDDHVLWCSVKVKKTNNDHEI